MSNHVTAITDANFEELVLKSETPVLVDFWAEWCAPCKAIAPMLEEAAPEYAGKVTIVKMNAEENANTSAKFGIRALPTLMLFKNGSVEATMQGALSRSQLNEFLSQNGHSLA
jgi:thioredoxin 1